jgi:hypothetical protein
MDSRSWKSDNIKGRRDFLPTGTYKAIVEVTTMDNDKTDLPQPIRYDFNIPVA